MGAGLWSRGRRGKSVPAWVGPTALLVVSGFFIGVVIWGLVNPLDVRVVYFDAGRADGFEISKVTPFVEQDLYVVGLEDGRLRAIDGRVEASGCSVRWLADDARGVAANPGGAAGVFEDPCSLATWSMLGDAIEGSREPLRTPYIDYRVGPDGRTTHAYIERVNP
ncbi:MAG: hypothetical protein AB7F65_09255 [Dehalococcoidia bacterium]